MPTLVQQAKYMQFALFHFSYVFWLCCNDHKVFFPSLTFILFFSFLCMNSSQVHFGTPSSLLHHSFEPRSLKPLFSSHPNPSKLTNRLKAANMLLELICRSPQAQKVADNVVLYTDIRSLDMTYRSKLVQVLKILN